MLPSLAVALGAAMWGIYWLPLRYAEQLGLSGPWAVVIVNLMPLFLLIPMSIRVRHAFKNDVGLIIVIGMLSGGALTFYAIGLVYTTVVRATMLFYLTPVWSTLIGLVILGETVRWNRWAAIAAGLCGLYFIVGGSTLSDTALNIGDWFGIASGLCWGIGAVLIKRHPQISVTGMVTSQHGAALTIAVLCCLLLPNIAPVPDINIWLESTPIILVYSWLGLVPSLFAIFWASGKLYPGRVGILMMTEVLVAVFSASLLLDEKIVTREWTGVALIIAAGFLEVSVKDTTNTEQLENAA